MYVFEVACSKMWLDRSEVTPLVMKESGKDVLNGHCGGGEVWVILLTDFFVWFYFFGCSCRDGTID